MPDNIINTFQQRREIQTRLAALADTTSEAEMLQVVRSIVQDFPHSALLSPYVKLLDTSNSQLRGGLAHLATLLPPDDIVPALQNTVANRKNATQVRLNAVTILERFLGQEVSPALLSDLENTDEIAFQSLCEAVEEGHRDRHIFLEYVIQMKEESVEVAYIVLEQLQRLPAVDQLEMLRIIAQEDREAAATAALTQLTQLSPTDAGERLIQILHTLQFALSPTRAQQAERALRKLRFSGLGYTSPPQDGWRALIAPAEASGNQTIWFFQTPIQGERECPFLSIVVNVATGILQAYGADRMPAEDLPSEKALGELITVAIDGGESIIFLEAPFDYGRWLVLNALPQHWAGKAWQPLFGEYTLYNDILWQFNRPEIDDVLENFFLAHSSQENSTQENLAQKGAKRAKEGLQENGVSPQELDASLDIDELDQVSAELLQHPAMSGWILHSLLVWNAIRSGFTGEEAHSLDEFTGLVVREIHQWPEYDLFIQGLCAGLQAQAGWLYLAGMEKASQQAHTLAESFRLSPRAQNPFLYHYIRRAIEGSS
ncbi:MAG: hypothetical protein AAF702_08550 [Chloroflexota bacterium]